MRCKVGAEELEQGHLNRQLEALQRYVADLSEQRKRARAEAAKLPPTPESRRSSKRWLLLTGLLVVVALTSGLVVGAVTWSDNRPAAANAGAARVSSATRSPHSRRRPVLRVLRLCSVTPRSSPSLLALGLGARGSAP